MEENIGMLLEELETYSPKLKVLYDNKEAILKWGDDELGRSYVFDNFLRLSINKKGYDIPGSLIFKVLYEKQKQHSKIEGIHAFWYYGSNLDTFNSLIRTGEFSEREAARATFTGKMTSRLGYDKVKILRKKESNKHNYFNIVEVLFT